MGNCDACYGEKTEDCPDDCLTSHIRYEEREFYVDYRFIVNAKDIHESGRKVDKFLPESTDDIWYSIIQISESIKEGCPHCGSKTKHKKDCPDQQIINAFKDLKEEDAENEL